ncbi:MAG TPA: hypothetical protein PLM51_03320 [Bacillota bacterium]|nr:hypothetical protein [Bacillota bacterium]HRX91478.1 hypothetical protein [Candidatus Izemoplasmatales bacterium]
MMFFATIKQTIEIIIVITVPLAILVTGNVLMIRSLKTGYKDVYKFQSKFDIELRKTINLFSKIDPEGILKDYRETVIKNISHEEKIELLDLVDEEYKLIDKESGNNEYAMETYENLQEMRRIHDTKALIFNHKILMFPFNVYARLFKIKKWDLYLHEKKEES